MSKKHTFEERVEFVAKHYRENSLNATKAWKKFAAERHIRPVLYLPLWIRNVAAAMLLLLALGSYLIYRHLQPDWVLIAAAPDQVTEVYLPDSSQVTLSAESTLRYDAKSFGKTERQVEMQGKAFYRVKRNEDCPFRISARNAQVTVLGTSFLVHEWEQDVEVQVLTGRVRFEAGQVQEVILTAGMKARYSDTEQKILTAEGADANALSWTNQELIFQEAPLQKVIHDLEVCYNVRITDSKPSTDSLRLTATFKQMPLEQVLFVINQTLDTKLKAEQP